MKIYYFKTTNREKLVEIGVDLDLLVVDEDGTRAASSDVSWDEIGHILVNDSVLVDEETNPYWHVNMMIPFDLREWAEDKYAEAMQAENFELAQRIYQHIVDSPQFFILDEENKPRAPNEPNRMFWII